MGSKFNTSDVVKYSAWEVKNKGYVKRGNDEETCTADKVVDLISTKALSEEELVSVKQYIVDWFDYVKNAKESEYFINLREVLNSPQIDEAKIGLVASSFSTFEKFLDFKSKKEKEKTSQYLGEVKDMVEFEISNYRFVKSGESTNGKKKTSWFLYNITTKEGNIVVWFADRDYTTEFQTSKKAKAIISQLNTFNNVKQTCVRNLVFV